MGLVSGAGRAVPVKGVSTFLPLFFLAAVDQVPILYLILLSKVQLGG